MTIKSTKKRINLLLLGTQNVSKSTHNVGLFIRDYKVCVFSRLNVNEKKGFKDYYQMKIDNVNGH